MKLFSKLRAFFKFKGESVEMDLSAAKINKDHILLHPADDPLHAFCISTKTIDLFINNGEELQEEDVLILDTEKVRKLEQKIEQQQNSIIKEKDKSIDSVPNYNHPLMLKRNSYIKKKFSIMLYPEEYEALMENIKSNGYKKSEYFLACVHAAKKQNMSSLYKHYITDHQKRKIEERNIINQIKQADLHNVN